MIAMALSGRSASGLSAAIASSDHLVIVPLKTLAMVSADMFRVSTPSTLKATAIGLTYAGTSIGSVAALLLGGGELALVVVHVGVAAGEGVGPTVEVLAPGTRADLFVVDRVAGLVLVVGAPDTLGLGLRGGAATIERDGLAVTVSAAGLGLVARSARGDREGQGEGGNRGDHAAAERSAVHFVSPVFVSGPAGAGHGSDTVNVGTGSDRFRGRW